MLNSFYKLTIKINLYILSIFFYQFVKSLKNGLGNKLVVKLVFCYKNTESTLKLLNNFLSNRSTAYHLCFKF